MGTIPIKSRVVGTMNVAQHAAKILTAWNGADPLGFERALAGVLDTTAGSPPADLLEYERREVLTSIVERLRGREISGDYQRLNAGFILLEHLSERSASA